MFFNIAKCACFISTKLCLPKCNYESDNTISDEDLPFFLDQVDIRKRQLICVNRKVVKNPEICSTNPVTEDPSDYASVMYNINNDCSSDVSEQEDTDEDYNTDSNEASKRIRNVSQMTRPAQKAERYNVSYRAAALMNATFNKLEHPLVNWLCSEI